MKKILAKLIFFLVFNKAFWSCYLKKIVICNRGLTPPQSLSFSSPTHHFSCLFHALNLSKRPISCLSLILCKKWSHFRDFAMLNPVDFLKWIQVSVRYVSVSEIYILNISIFATSLWHIYRENYISYWRACLHENVLITNIC